MNNILLFGQMAAAVGVWALGRGQEKERERNSLTLAACIVAIGVLARW